MAERDAELHNTVKKAMAALDELLEIPIRNKTVKAKLKELKGYLKVIDIHEHGIDGGP